MLAVLWQKHTEEQWNKVVTSSKIQQVKQGDAYTGHQDPPKQEARPDFVSAAPAI